MQSDKYAELFVVTLNRAQQIAHVFGVNVLPALNGHDRLLNRTRVILEKDQAINTFVCTFLATITRLSVNQRKSPQLEVMRTFRKQTARAIEVNRESLDLVVGVRSKSGGRGSVVIQEAAQS